MRGRPSVSIVITVVLIVPMLGFAGWMRTYGGSFDDWAWSVQGTSDGRYIVAGWSASNSAGLPDAWLLKVDIDGDTLWTRTWGTENYDAVTSARQTSDGGYILTGQRDGSYNVDKGDVWLLKTDSNGDTLWSRVYGGSNGDGGWCVRETSDNGYVIVGSRDITLAGCPASKIWLLKVNSSGDTLWTRAYGESGLLHRGYYVEQTSDGGYIITGDWQSDLCLIKTDKNGDTLWVARYNLYGLSNQGRCVHGTKDGNYMVVGFALKNPTDAEIWLLKFNPDGDTIWTRTFGVSNVNMGYSVCQTSDGGYVLTGVRNFLTSGLGGDLLLIRTDSNGDTLWSRSYGGVATDWGNCVQETSDGGFIIAGYTKSYGAGVADAWLIKTDEYGRVTVSEPVAVVEQDWELVSAIGSEIVLRYENRPEGFHARVFDASGRLVDQIHSTQTAGSVTWGDTAPVGVYFIKVQSSNPEVLRVVLIR